MSSATDRLNARRSLDISDADRRRVAEAATGLTMAVWLKSTRRATKGEATGIIFAGHDLAAHPQVGKAAVDGTVSTRQAACITAMLDDLPSRLSVEQQGRAAEFLVAKAARLDTNALKRLAGEALDVADPVESEADAAEREQVRLEAQQRRAERNRAFRYHYDDGSLHFSGQVPAVDGAELVRLVEARVEAVKRATRDDRRSAGVGRPEVTPEQRAADAFMAIIHGHDTAGGVRVAQDRARVVVHLDEDALHRRVEQAGLLPSGQKIPAGELRRLCCDADLTPVVLGTASEILDLGRTRRLVSDEIRLALSIRDHGCAFPDCDAADHECEAHHVVPWWAGGATTLGNLVLLCPKHHKLVEPPRMHHPPGHQPRDGPRLHRDASPRARVPCMGGIPRLSGGKSGSISTRCPSSCPGTARPDTLPDPRPRHPALTA
nr:HNH endonuclease signature motif containing protein [Tessaracoccus coleopterorum]